MLNQKYQNLGILFQLPFLKIQASRGPRYNICEVHHNFEPETANQWHFERKIGVVRRANEAERIPKGATELPEGTSEQLLIEREGNRDRKMEQGRKQRWGGIRLLWGKSRVRRGKYGCFGWGLSWGLV